MSLSTFRIQSQALQYILNHISEIPGICSWSNYIFWFRMIEIRLYWCWMILINKKSVWKYSVYFSVYSTNTKSNKWKKVVWHYIIDTTRVNCQTLLLVTNPDVYGLNKHRKPKVTSFEFGVELAKSLIMPWLQMRSLVRLTTYVRNAAYNFSDLPRYLTTAVAPTAVQFPHDSMSSKGLLEGYPRHRVFRQEEEGAPDQDSVPDVRHPLLQGQTSCCCLQSIMPQKNWGEIDSESSLVGSNGTDLNYIIFGETCLSFYTVPALIEEYKIPLYFFNVTFLALPYYLKCLISSVFISISSVLLDILAQIWAKI